MPALQHMNLLLLAWLNAGDCGYMGRLHHLTTLALLGLEDEVCKSSPLQLACCQLASPPDSVADAVPL